jgi:AcrR family transcriptional regulator
MALIEAEGAESVSMPRLATELGSSLTELYRHVPSRTALLDCVAATVIADIELPAGPSDDWDWQLRALAHAARRAARSHPRCALLAASRPPTSAGALRPVEAALATLAGAGFGGPESVAIIRALGAYLAGSLLRPGPADPRPRPSGLRPGQQTWSEAPHPRLRAAEFPLITTWLAVLAGTDADADFEFGLDLLMRGLALLRPPRTDADC